MEDEKKTTDIDNNKVNSDAEKETKLVLPLISLSRKEEKKIIKLKASRLFKTGAVLSNVFSIFIIFISVIFIITSFFGPLIVGSIDSVEDTINENKIHYEDPEYSELHSIIYDEIDECLGIGDSEGMKTLRGCINSFEKALIEDIIINETMNLIFNGEGEPDDYFVWITNSQKDPSNPEEYIEPITGLHQLVIEGEQVVADEIDFINDWIATEVNTGIFSCLIDGINFSIYNPYDDTEIIFVDNCNIDNLLDPLPPPPTGPPDEVVGIMEFYNWLYINYYTAPMDPPQLDIDDIPSIVDIDEKIYEFLTTIADDFLFQSNVIKEELVLPEDKNFSWYNFFLSVSDFVIDMINNFTFYLIDSFNELIFYLENIFLGLKVCDDTNLPDDSEYSCETIDETMTIKYELEKIDNFWIDINDLENLPWIELVVIKINETVDSIKTEFIDLSNELIIIFDDIFVEVEILIDDLLEYLVDTITVIEDWINDPEVVDTFTTVDTYYLFATNALLGLSLAPILCIPLFSASIAIGARTKKGKTKTKWPAVFFGYIALIVPGVLMTMGDYKTFKELWNEMELEMEDIRHNK